jgi:hypothetical protein
MTSSSNDFRQLDTVSQSHRPSDLAESKLARLCHRAQEFADQDMLRIKHSKKPPFLRLSNLVRNNRLSSVFGQTKEKYSWKVEFDGVIAIG